MLPTPLSCNKCRAALSQNQLAGVSEPCQSCRTEGRAEVFPAFLRDLPPSKLGAEIDQPEQASCFHHPSLSAVVACDFCGRFLCDLCDITFTDKHVCSACIERMALEEYEEQFTRSATNWDVVAFWTAIVGLFMMIAGPLAVAMFFVARKTQAVAPRLRLYGIIGLVLGLLETVGAILIVLMLWL
jgi:hypothetical protein